MPTIQPLVTNSKDRFKWVEQKAVQELSKLFPIESDNYVVSLDSMRLKRPDTSITKQKDAIINKNSLMVPIFFDLTIKDKKNNKIVEKIKDFKLAEIPFLTSRMTMILEGNDYSTVTQLRMKPGVYSRRRDNDIVEAFFNLAAGRNFRMIMDPAIGIFFIEINNTKIPLYPILSAFGVQDSDIKSYWGKDLLNRNKSKTGSVPVAINKLYAKLFNTSSDMNLSTSEKVSKIGEYFSNKTSMDVDVNASTIGVSANKVNIQAILAASKKILNILKDQDDSDDRDNLKYQTIHTIDDAIRENISKTAPEIIRKLRYRLDSLSKEKKPSEVLPRNAFGQSIKKFLTTTSIAAPLPQINPVDIIGNAYEITHLGPGGIKDVRMVRPETRQVNSSHIGIIDPVNTKENEKAGVTLFATRNAYKDVKGNIYSKLRNIKTNKEEVISASQLESKVVAFPDQDLSSPSKKVEVLYEGKVQQVPASRVQYQLPSTSNMFSMQTNLLPFVNSISGIRALMAAKHYTHSLPLKDRDEPLIQVMSDSPFKTQEKLVASMIVPKAKKDGVITSITKDLIKIRTDDGEDITDHYETNFPLNQKTFLHTDLNVKKGDRVKRNQLLGESIYTKDGSLAMGKNLNVAYLNYKGLNVNDGVVISEGAAKKLTSLHMSKVHYNMDDNHFIAKDKFTSLFPNKYNIGQIKDVDHNGVIKKGSSLNEGDPIVLGVEKTELSAEQSLLGNLHRKLYKPFRDDSITWDAPFAGEVVDVSVTSRHVTVSIKSEQPARIGDKISQRSAGKGVVTAIINDSDMFKNTKGETLDVLMSPTGIISRQNPSQILETSLAKVAKKLGRPISIDNFKIKDNHKFVSDMMKKHGVKDKENLFDPKHNRVIKNVMTGPQYILKQSNQASTGFSARNFGSYDSNSMPVKGGDDGSKTIGTLDINSLISHNARNILKEISSVKGTKNTDFWNAYMRGLPLPSPSTPFSYDKFLGMLTASGMKINKNDNKLIASPLTDRDITKMSSGEVKSPFTVRAKDLRPEKNGLFDMGITGGMSGSKWSHIKLNEPVINPMMKKPVQILLGQTEKGLDNKIKLEGVNYIKKQLSKIEVDKRIRELNKEIPNLKHNSLDKATKELKYLKALKDNGLRPQEAYVLNNIPVLPPIMRPIVKLSGSNDLQVSSSNRLYSDIIHTNNAISTVKKSMSPKDVESLRGTMQQSVDALVGVADSPNIKIKKQGLKGILTTVSGDIPKRGFFQSKVISKPQDLAGRAVIVPRPNLAMDQVSIPEDMMWKTFHPMIVKRLVQKGYPVTKAIEMVRNKDFIARQEMIAESKERPVLLNRAPNLHKYNIVSAYAIPSKEKVIGISPFMEKGQGADFDGDTMQKHVPVSYKAVEEAKRMTLPNLLFSDKTKAGNLMAKPEQDTNYGIYTGVNASATGKIYNFNNYDEVKQAYKQGKIGINDKVKVKGS